MECKILYSEEKYMEIDLTHGNLQIITDEIVRYQYEGNDLVMRIVE